jgi:ubiquinone/menaquinone biosynthesis C-methylase UbiE
LKPLQKVLDVGCGTGALLYEAWDHYPQAQFYGVDPVEEMLGIARKRLPESIELRRGWAEELPFGNKEFDVVVSCNMFHYVRHPIEALREMRRVLCDGGTLVITDWCADYRFCRMCELYLRLFTSVHVNVYRERECFELLRKAGHGNVAIERYKISWLWGLMTATTTKVTSLPRIVPA